jgi:hypothetical protein
MRRLSEKLCIKRREMSTGKTKEILEQNIIMIEVKILLGNLKASLNRQKKELVKLEIGQMEMIKSEEQEKERLK